jgi:hypothetical protein
MPQHITTGSFAEAAAMLKADFEASNAKFKADLESLSPRKPVSPAKADSSGKWILARKCWSWLYRD